jgi:hypothetical protein
MPAERLSMREVYEALRLSTTTQATEERWNCSEPSVAKYRRGDGASAMAHPGRKRHLSGTGGTAALLIAAHNPVATHNPGLHGRVYLTIYWAYPHTGLILAAALQQRPKDLERLYSPRGTSAQESLRLWPNQSIMCRLGQRFLGSNHIRQPRRACRTKCGRPRATSRG